MGVGDWKSWDFKANVTWDWTDWQIGPFGVTDGVGLQLFCLGITIWRVDKDREKADNMRWWNFGKEAEKETKIKGVPLIRETVRTIRYRWSDDEYELHVVGIQEIAPDCWRVWNTYRNGEVFVDAQGVQSANETFNCMASNGLTRERATAVANTLADAIEYNFQMIEDQYRDLRGAAERPFDEPGNTETEKEEA